MSPAPIFRQSSLDKLGSSERIDRPLRIVRPHVWILWSGLALCLVLLLTWSVVGRVAATARGTAVLVRPRQVVSFQSPTSGQIHTIDVEAGQRVEVGTLLVTLRLPQVKKELAQQREELALVERLSREKIQLETALGDRERASIARRRQQIADRMREVEQGADAYREKSAAYVTEQRTNLEKAMALSAQLGVKLREKLAGLRDLQTQEAMSRFAAIETEAAVIDNELRSQELLVKVAELRLRESRVDEYYNERVDVLRGLELELANLDVREVLIERRLLDVRGESTREAAEIEQRIGQLETALETEGQVLSEHAGRILEISVALGQQMPLGERIGRMEVDDPSAEVMAIAWFDIADGKKIPPGARIRVAPTTVERERFGGIVGDVETISEYPITTEGAARQIGDLEMARNLLGGQSRIQVVASLRRDPAAPTGYRWTSGRGPDHVAITAGTTAEVRVTLEERAPISLVLPFLRSLLGS